MGKILVVDDDVAAVDVIRRTLEAEGHDVETAPDGASAFAKIKI